MPMPDRRKFGCVIAAHLIASPLVARAQQTAQRPRVGMLLPGAADSTQVNPNVAAFEGALRDRGWIEGKNLLIERRYAEGHSDRYRDLALDLVRQNVEGIVPAGGPASLKAARDATKTIPIVMVASARDPVAEGLIKSFARPQGNITGIVHRVRYAHEARLAVCASYVRVRRIHPDWDPARGDAEPVAIRRSKLARRLAGSSGLRNTAWMPAALISSSR